MKVNQNAYVAGSKVYNYEKTAKIYNFNQWTFLLV